jgi:membrane protein YqaA with SNARE-associated domain
LGLFRFVLGCFLAATIFLFNSDALSISALALDGNIALTLWSLVGGLATYWIGYTEKREWIIMVQNKIRNAAQVWEFSA